MALDPPMRGALDKMIDMRFQAVAAEVKLCKTFSKEFGIKDEDEFIYGDLIGRITSDFHCAFRGAKDRDIIEEEAKEANAVIFMRAREIRDAISNVA